MKFFKAIGKFFSKIFQSIKKFFKGKDPITAINDTVKAAVTIGTAGITAYAAINTIRAKALAQKAAKNNQPNNKSDRNGLDVVLDQRQTGSVEEKLRAARMVGYKIPGRAGLTDEDLEILKDIAKQRNAYFTYLTPQRQMELLKKEGFDYDGYKVKWRNAGTGFPWGKKQAPKISNKKPTEYWEVKNCGIFTPITKAIQTFWHWLICDPKPREDVYKNQLKIVNTTWYTEPIMKDRKTQLKWVANMQSCGKLYIPAPTPAGPDFDPIKDAILAEETFRYDDPLVCADVIRRRMALARPEEVDIMDIIRDPRNFTEIDGYHLPERDRNHIRTGGMPDPLFNEDDRRALHDGSRSARSPRAVGRPDYMDDYYGTDYLDRPRGSRVPNRNISAYQAEVDAAAERSQQRFQQILRMTPQERLMKLCQL